MVIRNNKSHQWSTSAMLTILLMALLKLWVVVHPYHLIEQILHKLEPNSHIFIYLALMEVCTGFFCVAGMDIPRSKVSPTEKPLHQPLYLLLQQHE